MLSFFVDEIHNSCHLGFAMNLRSLRYRLKSHIDQTGDDDPRLDRLVALYRKVNKKIEEHDREDRLVKFHALIRRGMTNWRLNKKFMAIDVERTPEGTLHEVGVTLFQGKTIESFNYRLPGIERGPSFIFGKTILGDRNILKNCLFMHSKSVDYYVGHSIRFDLKHLHEEGIEIPSKYYFDTAEMMYNFKGYRPRLFELAREYQVGQSQMHCGGNDARYTAEIFLKIINTHGC